MTNNRDSVQPTQHQQNNPYNQSFNPQEEILWYRTLQKGIFRKKNVEVIVVTNHRVMKEYPLNGKLFSLLLTQIDDVQVLNQHRDSNSSMTGVGVRSGNMRTTQYQGRSRSKTIGSIMLMSKDNPDFSLDNIQDPVGLANMIKSARKMMLEEQKEGEEKQGR
jgi:hypothetical protein